MALAACPECGGSLSVEAKACIHCGHPMRTATPRRVGVKWLAVLVALLGIGYVAAGPYLTVYELRVAAKKHDASALSEYVDFPSVRQSLKDQANGAFLKEMASNGDVKGNPFGALATAFAGTLIDKMVDAYMTPEGLIALMSGEKVIQRQAQGHGHVQGRPVQTEPLSGASMSYRSLNEFVVRARGDSSTLVFRRYGFRWKLAEIRIPADRRRLTR